MRECGQIGRIQVPFVARVSIVIEQTVGVHLAHGLASEARTG
jgi:hypothetical protein